MTGQFTITANGQSTPDLGGPAGEGGGVVVQITGTWTGTLQFEGSVDGATYTAVMAQNVTGVAAATSTTANGQFKVPADAVGNVGLNYIRVSSIAAWTGSALIRGQPFKA